jgi:hypothetical protein
MTDRLKEAKEILEIVETSNSEKDALSQIELSGYSEEEAEAVMDAALEILFISA